MKRLFLIFLVTSMLTIFQGGDFAQSMVAGYWEGSIDVLGNELKVGIDLNVNDENMWTGDIDIPAQGAKDLPLGNIRVDGENVTFDLLGIPGNPSFKGQLSADGTNISGDFTQSGQTFQFTLERKEKDKEIAPAEKQTYGPTPEQGMPGEGLEGAWQGSIYIHFNLAVEDQTGTLTSEAMGGTELTLDTISREDQTIRFSIGLVGVNFEGTLNADGTEISGTWKQGPQPALALTFARDVADVGLDGEWKGSLELRLVVNISKEDDETFKGSLDSPDQGSMAIGLPIGNIEYDEGLLRFGMPAIGASFEGMMNPEGSAIDGHWRQAGVSPLSLKRLSYAPKLPRPQEPKKPYPYDEQLVTYENPAADITLAGTLTLPHGEGPFPAVVLVSGSGPQDRDETIFGHRPFLVLADHLTRQGIAVLRYDDRGVGKSTGNFGEATSEDFASDAAAGVVFLQTQSKIDANHIGIIGHSEGGIIAPIVASESEDVAFIVLIAPPGVVGEELLYLQAELLIRASGESETLISFNRDVQEKMFSIIKELDDLETARETLGEALDTLIANLSPEDAETLGNRISIVKAQAESQMASLNSRWFRFFLTYQPLPTLVEVKCPVLALFGELDLQVPPSQNASVIEEALESGGHTDYTVKTLPQLNHLFQTCETGALAEYGEIEETMAQVALETISTWIGGRVK